MPFLQSTGYCAFRSEITTPDPFDSNLKGRIYSFAAEVEYHARYLIGLAKIKIPFFKKTIYDSAIRADMTTGDVERIRPASYYRETLKSYKDIINYIKIMME